MTPEADTPSPVAVGKPVKNYDGVRGWLLLLCCIMVLVVPFTRGSTVYYDLTILFALGGETSLEPGLAHNLSYAVGIESFVLFCSAVLSLVAGIALLMRKQYAPWLAKMFWASGPVLNVLLFLVILLLFPQGQMFDDASHQVLRDFFSSLFGAVLWISYLIKSKRVKATYPRAPGANAGPAEAAV